MSDVELGQGTYVAGQGGAGWGTDFTNAASQLAPGDTAKMRLTFPMPISFIPGDWLAGALGPLFAASGQTLIGVDWEGDSTLVLTWTVG